MQKTADQPTHENNKKATEAYAPLLTLTYHEAYKEAGAPEPEPTIQSRKRGWRPDWSGIRYGAIVGSGIGLSGVVFLCVGFLHWHSDKAATNFAMAGMATSAVAFGLLRLLDRLGGHKG